MDTLAELRLARLIQYMLENGMTQDDGRPSPGALAAATGRKPNYCNDLLKGGKKSFGAQVARALERELGMAPYHLDGVTGSWPFSMELLAEVLELRKAERLQLEGALRLVLAQIKAADPAKANAA